VKSKYLTSLDSEDIYDDVVEKKALPELILKANILMAQDVLLTSERILMTNYRLSGKFGREDIINFEGNLVLLWSFIRQMVEEQGISTENKKYYSMLLDLEFGKRISRTSDLFYVRNFLMSCLHKINITNLFQSKGKSFDSYLSNL
jgi:hypothetical protein